VKSIAILVISLGIILLGAEVFVNGIEWLGKKLNLSEGAVGSVLAAVGTALPETLIPIIAIVFSDAAQGHEIGIGAILGAPLMLATLAMCVTGIAVVIFRRRRAFGVKVVADYYSMSRDLGFFILVYAAAVLAGLIPPHYRAWQVGDRGHNGTGLLYLCSNNAVSGTGYTCRSSIASILFGPE
jgi:cation:H+ antiporter